MFNPELMEEVVAEQRGDRLHEAENYRLLKINKKSASNRLKLTVVVSGAGLTALMIFQMLAT